MRIIQKKLTSNSFLREIYSNFGIIFILVYGLFLIFYKWSGSFMGDEATYAQVAKESILNNSYMILHWKGQLWFEKPPLVIWLNITAFNLFGISETSARLFPGLLGVASAALIFLFAKDLFKSQLAGFFSGLIFLTSPIILRYLRSNMMDIPVGFFVLAACYSVWKIIEGENRWWISLGASLGMGVMTKSVIGLFPVAIFILYLLFFCKKKVSIINNHSIYGFFVFLAISIPWHLYMTLKFGNTFWKEYIGFHVFNRFANTIFPYPWEGNKPLAYFELFFNWSGIWIWLFLTISVVFVLERYISKRERHCFTFWDINVCKFEEEEKNKYRFLGMWLAVVTLPFFLASTKLPNYMVLAYYPLAIATGGFLAKIFAKKQIGLIYLISMLSLLNFLPAMQFSASEYGEAHFLLPKLFIRFLEFKNEWLFILMLAIGIGITVFSFGYKKNSSILIFICGCIFLGMNLLIPFAPKRNEFLKQLGDNISNFSNKQPVNLFVIMKPDQYSFQCVGYFYLPKGSQISNLGRRRIKLIDKNARGNSFCFFEKDFLNGAVTNSSIAFYKEGILTRCKLEEN
jgi:hypothetical protein